MSSRQDRHPRPGDPFPLEAVYPARDADMLVLYHDEPGDAPSPPGPLPDLDAIEAQVRSRLFGPPSAPGSPPGPGPLWAGSDPEQPPDGMAFELRVNATTGKETYYEADPEQRSSEEGRARAEQEAAAAAGQRRADGIALLREMARNQSGGPAWMVAEAVLDVLGISREEIHAEDAAGPGAAPGAGDHH